MGKKEFFFFIVCRITKKRSLGMEVERIGGDLGDKREQTMTVDTFHRNSVDSNHKTATPGISGINEVKTTD